MSIDPIMIEPIMREYFQDTTLESVDYTVNGKCSNCGSCCSNRLPMTDTEVQQLKSYVKRNKIKPLGVKLNVLAGPAVDMTCPFLDKDGGCTIYKMRPKICKLFSCNKPNINMFKDLSKNLKYFHGLKTRFLRETLFEEE